MRNDTQPKVRYSAPRTVHVYTWNDTRPFNTPQYDECYYEQIVLVTWKATTRTSDQSLARCSIMSTSSGGVNECMYGGVLILSTPFPST
jgi:hypothetical protein